MVPALPWTVGVSEVLWGVCDCIQVAGNIGIGDLDGSFKIAVLRAHTVND